MSSKSLSFSISVHQTSSSHTALGETLDLKSVLSIARLSLSSARKIIQQLLGVSNISRHMADASPDTVLCLKHIYKYLVFNTPLHVSTLIAGTEHRNLWDTQYSRWAQAAAAPKPCSVLSRQLKCRVLGGVSGGSSPNFYTVSGVGDACLVAPIGLVACGQGSGARPPLCHAGGRCSDHSGGGRTGTLSPRGGFSNEPTPLCDNSSAQIN